MNRERKAKKTVYFLGAGFSAPMGAPIQSKILGDVVKCTGSGYGVSDFNNKKKKLLHFISDAFSLEDDQIANFPLEDFYTPIDRCISQNTSFRGYPASYLSEMRNVLSQIISIVVNDGIVDKHHSADYINKFVKHVVDVRSTKKDDAVIITTNWDIILDTRLFTILNNKYSGINESLWGVMDLGTHASPQNKDTRSSLTPPLIAQGKNGFSIKLFKIHGSLNWLKCPNCNRLYVDADQKSAIMAFNKEYTCKKCTENFKISGVKDENGGMYTEPQIIYPTFVKDFQNIHFQRIWDSAATEIREASKIVFIGYSFQQSDFEIRQLISRNVPDDCEVEWVLRSELPPLPHEGDEFHKERKAAHWNHPHHRYETFFGRRSKRPYYDGVEKYIKEELN